MQDDKNILAVTMPNPVSIPTKAAEIRAILDAATGEIFRGKLVMSEMLLPGDQEINQALPPCIKDTAHLLRKAFKYAEGFDRLPDCYVRRDSEYPYGRHIHEEMTGCADIFGSTAVFYKGTKDKPGEGHSLPARHIAVFRDIVFKPGDEQPGVQNVMMSCH